MASIEERARQAGAKVEDSLAQLLDALNNARANGVVVNFTLGELSNGKMGVTKMEVLVRVPHGGAREH